MWHSVCRLIVSSRHRNRIKAMCSSRMRDEMNALLIPSRRRVPRQVAPKLLQEVVESGRGIIFVSRGEGMNEEDDPRYDLFQVIEAMSRGGGK